MFSADALLAPQAYTWWVPAVGGALLLAVAAWYAWVLLSTRHEHEPKVPPMDPAGRARYERAVEEIFASYHSDDLDLRGLHLELARNMRAFASERIGRDVSSWTRADVATYDPTRRVGDLLAVWEEPSFARRSDAEATAATEQAREVIRQW